MIAMSLTEVQTQLPQLIHDLHPGDEILITLGSQPVAKLTGTPLPKGKPIYGRGAGKIITISDDDEHLKDFAEYMA